jgi:hypothetical protein
MIQDFPSDDPPPVDLLEATEDLYRQAAEDLVLAQRKLRQGSVDEVKAAAQAVKDLKAAYVRAKEDEKARAIDEEIDQVKKAVKTVAAAKAGSPKAKQAIKNVAAASKAGVPAAKVPAAAVAVAATARTLKAKKAAKKKRK